MTATRTGPSAGGADPITSESALAGGSWQARLPARIARDGQVWGNTTIALEAWKKAELCPERIAIFLEHEPDATYGALAEEARRLITGLRGLGLQAGDVISFQLPNWREAVPIDIAAAALGLVVNPVVPIYRGAELAFILKDARTRAFFIPERFRSIDYVEMDHLFVKSHEEPEEGEAAAEGAAAAETPAPASAE